ncbi:MAG: serine acetyltransferase [Deltaproteobacteria bacterium]|nr:serine acetyltransferase [Deltaproteobacteria bacterium]
MDDTWKTEQCEARIATTHQFRKEIPDIVNRLILTCDHDECFDHVSPEPIPSRDAVIDLIDRARRILFPGYFDHARLDEINLGYYFGHEINGFFEVLSEQIALSIRHECLRYGHPCTHCEERGEQEGIRFIGEMPGVRLLLAKDVRASYDGDPAARSHDEIIFSYPGLFAITVYRIAHQLFEQEIPLIPRIMTEYAHSLTGIDIHPGAHIGESFFVDHGTGVVVGETTQIGDRVRIYQGVTLGALSLPSGAVEGLRLQKRHPTVEDDVIIYSNATILGGDIVIGARSIIGGNVWITESVPPDNEVFLKKPELIMKGKPA